MRKSLSALIIFLIYPFSTAYSEVNPMNPGAGDAEKADVSAKTPPPGVGGETSDVVESDPVVDEGYSKLTPEEAARGASIRSINDGNAAEYASRYMECVRDSEARAFQQMFERKRCCVQMASTGRENSGPDYSMLSMCNSASTFNTSDVSNRVSICCQGSPAPENPTYLKKIEGCGNQGAAEGDHWSQRCLSNPATPQLISEHGLGAEGTEGGAAPAVAAAPIPVQKPCRLTPEGCPAVGGGTTSPTRSPAAATAGAAVQSANDTDVQPPEIAEPMAQKDKNLARTSTDRGTMCCNDPYKCGSVTPPPSSGAGGMQECQQGSGLAGQSSSVNSQLSGICSSEERACEMTINPLLQKYVTLKQKCNNSCDSASIYSSTYNSLAESKRICIALRDKAEQIAAQGSQSSLLGGTSDACKQKSMDAQSMGEEKTQAEKDQEAADNEKKTASTGVDCTATPEAAECQSQKLGDAAQQNAALTENNAQAGIVAGNTGPNFNPPEQQSFGSLLGSNPGTPGSAPTYNTIANNTGGSIPGGGGGGGGGGAAAAKPKGPQGSSYSTDILNGYNGAGGYSQDAAGMQPQSAGDEFNNWGKTRGPASATNGKNAYQGMDLKRYLPGGDLDPNLRVGGFGMAGGQINGQSADIWKIINNKFNEKCKLGTLYSCDR